MADIEIYLRDCPIFSLRTWVARWLGSLTELEQIGDAFICYAYSDNSQIPVVFTPKVDGNFTSLYFPINGTCWDTDIACARQAALDLGCEVRCDPGLLAQSPYNDEILSIIGEHEEVISWVR